MDTVEIVIIGAGVVGVALARELAQHGHEILLLETEAAIGTVTTARNSGVIHAGLYYKPGSLKARVCVEGRKQLYNYLETKGIPYRRCGKLVVATSEDQVEGLHRLKKIAENNGVTELQLLTADEARALEPEVFCVAALLSPDTGILDVHSYLLSLLGDAEAEGATLALQAPVTGGAVLDEGFCLEVGGTAPFKLKCHFLINAAGLGAQKIAASLKGLDPATIPSLLLGKGNYFSMTGKPPFRRLIYPLPGVGSLGLHATCDLSGRNRFGPDIEWVDKIDYEVDPLRVSLFEQAIRRYWPGLPEGVLQPDYSGIRPKIARGTPYETDFVIQSEEQHHIPRLINLYGIESPGLTSSLALAQEVASRLKAEM